MTRRKIIKILLGLMGLLLAFFFFYALWVWFQGEMWAVALNGRFPIDFLFGQLPVPRTAWLYGALAALFLLITAVLIWFVFRLIRLPPPPDDGAG
jgi:TRAP-type C4-dicarboxylate transport system permease small subunit